ncbi:MULTISPECIES: hypothetical protein [Sphingobacterium]|uniref:hypothetical protein n=1 Tax=Sphingobacterium TaxID=28453 RepID=UPI00257DF3A4|nr:MULTISPECIES: hypothetical protein [Sphingobacterium]
MSILIIDLFAGPRGLGECFSSMLGDDENCVFQIKLSIEKDPYANQTLRLRRFFRQFTPDQIPQGKNLLSVETEFSPQDFLIKSENYGVLQKRHRIILLGIRSDINVVPEVLVQ